ncbi:MAG: WS/DGAT/MGAT family O-acyltransferase [Pseudomarimonas sp.]
MANRPLNLLDASWLLVESSETPMHVGALMPFSLPDDAGPDFVRDIMLALRAATAVEAPWNRKLHTPVLRGLIPLWMEVDHIDLEHHVRHSALPAPGGERELGQLIARLHSQPLDLTRPPWEVELIEGLEGGRFALYTKVHHALMDGIGGVKLLVRAMSTDRKASRKIAPFWTIKPEARPRKRDQDVPPATVAQMAAQLVETVRSQAGSMPNIARAFGAMVSAVRNKNDVLSVPFDTPVSILNGRIRGPRRFATARFPLDRLKAVAKAGNATLNDVVLALCGAALRRFMLELGELPDKPLTAGIPVSVRPSDDDEAGADAGNAITFIISTLGTDIEDPIERLTAIRASTRRAKEHVQSLPRKSMLQYTLLLMAPYMASLLTGVGGRTRPMFNITISNVPGPDAPLYFRGAQMEASYPVSLVSHGQALNITCQSYAGHLHFGFTGCRDSLPHMQRLAPYTAEALDELEASLASAALAASVPAPKLKTQRKAARKAANIAAVEPAAVEPGKAVASKPAKRRKTAGTPIEPVVSPLATKKKAAFRVGSKVKG